MISSHPTLGTFEIPLDGKAVSRLVLLYCGLPLLSTLTRTVASIVKRRSFASNFICNRFARGHPGFYAAAGVETHEAHSTLNLRLTLVFRPQPIACASHWG